MDENKIYIKIVKLIEIFNFLVHDLLNLNSPWWCQNDDTIFGLQIQKSRFYHLFWQDNLQGCRSSQVTKREDADLLEQYNFFFHTRLCERVMIFLAMLLRQGCEQIAFDLSSY